MENSPTTIEVVAAALTGEGGRVLMQRRPAGKQHGGLWEFPGGKVEPGETHRAALVRELNEELGIGVESDALTPVGAARSPATDTAPAVVISLYRVFRWTGKPVAEAGACIGWFALDDTARLALPPLDIALIAGLRAGGG